ncbi:MAG: NHLP family bacteriocin export ABC transporter peptidase/permease/ATPase subunit [Desulfarculus sp.]|nr:NHLP family bacteriocin export ABC transporter peptidase/permease/ATPase subunit [Desulfarculus sp.]
MSAARRVRTPTILQMEAVECGAASLAMVLGHFGLFLPLEELREACGVSRDGSKASNMVKAAKGYGLEAHGFRKEADDLAELPLPLVVFWNYNHFLVVEGFSPDKVFLNDPAAGPRTVSPQEFQRQYSGVALTFETTAQFKKGGHPHTIYASLMSRLRWAKRGLVFAVLCGLGLVAPGLLVPTFSKVFVDQYLVAGLEYWVRPLLLAMALTIIIQCWLTWLQQKALLRLETKISLSTSAAFLMHVLKLPSKFFSMRFAGDISSRVAINDRVASMLSGQLATNLLGMGTLFFYAFLMVQYDGLLTLVVVAVGVANLGLLKYVSRKRKDLNLRLMQDQGKLQGASMNGLQTLETLKASGSESDFFARWSGYYTKTLNSQQQFGIYDLFLSEGPTLLSHLNTTAILGLGSLLIMDGGLTMGMLLAFQLLMGMFLGPLNALVGLGGSIQEMDGGMRRLDDVLRYPQDPSWQAEPPAPAQARGKLAGFLELRDLTFGYSPVSPPLVTGLDIKLEPGSRVALVGGSGSGKSTIAKLVTGLLQPWSGQVLLDGRPRLELPRRLVTSSLALVDQNIMLFQGTVRENLSLWNAEVPDQVLARAAKDANIHEEIMGRSGGYDAWVEEGGANFSGGQRQRLEIARALVGEPSILVLDEATSALDPLSERIIDDNLRRRGITCLIVAHRLSTIRDCDEIIVLEGGQVAQRGRHEELMADAQGLYANLIQTE